MFAETVRAHRQRRGITQQELAAQTGVSERTIRNVEAGRTRRPRPATVRLLADDFGLEGAERDQFCTATCPETFAPDSRETGHRDRPVPAQLPATTATFTGRSGQLRNLTALLDTQDSPASAIAAVTGPPGIGKTSLALRWAHHVASRFPDGQLYLDLGGFHPTGPTLDASAALAALLDPFTVPREHVPEGTQARAALFRSLLATRRVLLVLDNARGSEQVRALLPGAAGCLTVVTSRNPLAGLVAVEGATPLGVDVLSYAEARRLLAERLGTERVEAEPDAVGEIVSNCDGVPIALAIVAGLAATRPQLTLPALAGRLRDDVLGTLSGADTAADLRAVFASSYRVLSPAAAHLFRSLSLLPGQDISVPAAAILTGTKRDRARTLLAELADAQLIAVNAPDRFTLHRLLRAYATELADADSGTAPHAAALRPPEASTRAG